MCFKLTSRALNASFCCLRMENMASTLLGSSFELSSGILGAAAAAARTSAAAATASALRAKLSAQPGEHALSAICAAGVPWTQPENLSDRFPKRTC